MQAPHRPTAPHLAPGTLRSAGAITALAYAAAVALVELARAGIGGFGDADLASSPAGLAGGRVWQLVTSGLVVAGDPVVQLVALAPLAVLVSVRLGPWAFWRAAIAGHVGATLLAYAGVGVLWLLVPSDVDGVISAPDYGISCVLAGALGALVAGSGRVPRRHWPAILAAVACVSWLPFWGDIAGVEHFLAFGLGALVTARARPRPRVP